MEIEHNEILEEISEGVIIADNYFNIYYTNKYAKFIFDLQNTKDNEILTLQELPSASSNFLASLKFTKDGKKIQRLGILEFRKNRNTMLLDVTCNITSNNRFIFHFKNVTDLLELMDSVVTKENQFSNLFHSIPDILLLINKNKTLVMANDSIHNILGWIPKKIVGKNFENFIHEEDKSIFRELYKNSLQKSDIQLAEIRIQNRAGGYSTIEFFVYSDKAGESGRVYYLGRDVTERFQYDNFLIEKISKDELTKLSSKKFLFESVDLLIQDLKFGKLEELYIFYIDIDRFKDINDSLGHEAGDTVLKIVANRLKDVISQNNDYFLARIGGDEFALVTQCKIRSINIIDICNKIQKALSEIIHIERQSILLTCSIGVSKGDKSSTDAEKLLRNADIAMHEAKKLGRGKFNLYELKMQEKKFNSLQMSSWLREAIVNESLNLHVQPIYSTKENKISHAEALCRWNHPMHGYIPPAEFIQIAEETGQIHTIGDWILINTCKQIERWNLEKKTIIPIAINLSPLQFENKNLPQLFAKYLTQYHLEAENIHIELTESLIMSNIKHSINVLYELKKMGLTIYLDDFGTGYSSLNYLIHFPIDIIKIDKSFIDNLQHNNNGLSVVKAIIKMAESLLMKVVAEGVENKDQFDLLCEIGCDYVQGYYINKPIPIDEFNLDSLNQRWQKNSATK
ncbi:EAL domain-containing protein [Leptospira terpstrae]|uniref:EAL domain-containing protein n=1 Tax=Leptospira terpstrae TaxID=293075 RepID=UPI003D08CC08